VAMFEALEVVKVEKWSRRHRLRLPLLQSGPTVELPTLLPEGSMALNLEDPVVEQLEEAQDIHTYKAGSTGKTAGIALLQDAAAAAAVAPVVPPALAEVGTADKTKLVVLDAEVELVLVVLLVDAAVDVLVVASLMLVGIAHQEEERSYRDGADIGSIEDVAAGIAGAKALRSSTHAAHQKAEESGAAVSRHPQKIPQVQHRGAGGAPRCHCCWWKMSRTVQSQPNRRP